MFGRFFRGRCFFEEEVCLGGFFSGRRLVWEEVCLGVFFGEEVWGRRCFLGGGLFGSSFLGRRFVWELSWGIFFVFFLSGEVLGRRCFFGEGGRFWVWGEVWQGCVSSTAVAMTARELSQVAWVIGIVRTCLLNGFPIHVGGGGDWV